MKEENVSMNYSGISKRIAALTVAAMLSTAAAFAAEPVPGVQILKYDRPAAVSEMPANFRTAQSQYKTAKDGIYPSREGLDNLRQSGSSFFSIPVRSFPASFASRIRCSVSFFLVS